MNHEAPRSLRARHRVGLVQALGAVALALVFSAACSFGSVGQPSSHACADKIASAVTTGHNTPGLWNCLDPKLQASLNSLGLSGDSAFAFSNSTVISVHYVGEANGIDVYTVAAKTSSGIVSLALAVYVNSAGLVTNIGVATPAF